MFTMCIQRKKASRAKVRGRPVYGTAERIPVTALSRVLALGMDCSGQLPKTSHQGLRSSGNRHKHIGLNRWKRIQDEVLDHETQRSLVSIKIFQLGCYDGMLDKIKFVYDMLIHDELNTQETLDAVPLSCRETK